MNLNSTIFIWGFLPLSLVLVRMAKARYQNLVLTALSLLFWFYNDPLKKPYLLGTVLLTYAAGILMDRLPRAKKWVLFLGICADLGLLGLYKCLHAVTVPPVAISFVSFSLVSYLADVYTDSAKAGYDPVNYFLYVAFFPKLLMGPIERYKDFSLQLKAENRDYSARHFSEGIRLFVIGLAKKVLIADVLAAAADNAFSNASALSASGAWIGALCFMLQLYYDFSGYSEMAQGIGNMFGFSLTRNFDYPYLSQSITEFWRRWHITLGSWFRNYLYIPLGGNRKGKVRTYLNLFIVFLATGIWHGNGLTYILWGVYNGIFIVIERAWLLGLIKKSRLKVLHVLLCDLAVLFGWILFRADSLPAALGMMKVMLSGGSGTLTAGSILSLKTCTVLIIAIAGAGLVQQIAGRIKAGWNIRESRIYPVLEDGVLCIFLVLSIMSVSSGTYSAFLYAKF